MKDEALVAALIAALFDYPISLYLEKRPGTSIFYRMLLVGGVAYVGVKAASSLVEED
tara:strand:- start:1 stop:171 length:171 start_codon:yes stop_codon:yes gene_type:complete